MDKTSFYLASSTGLVISTPSFPSLPLPSCPHSAHVSTDPPQLTLPCQGLPPRPHHIRQTPTWLPGWTRGIPSN